MNDFKIVESKLLYVKLFWSKVKFLSDGSVCFIKYKEYPVDKTIVFIGPNDTHGWGADQRYYLDVNFPKPRELLICIIVIRTSQNNYKAVYTDNKKSEIFSFNGLSDLNDYLFSFC